MPPATRQMPPRRRRTDSTATVETEVESPRRPHFRHPPPMPTMSDEEEASASGASGMDHNDHQHRSDARPRRRTALEAFANEVEEAEADDEGGPTASPQTRPGARRVRPRTNIQQFMDGVDAIASSSRAAAQPEVIDLDDLDDSDEAGSTTNSEADRMRETLARQRADQVAAQAQNPSGGGRPDSPPRLNKLQCVICMDDLTDGVATVCGHIFCNMCLDQALRASEVRRQQATGMARGRAQCPVCRTALRRRGGLDIFPLSIMLKRRA